MLRSLWLLFVAAFVLVLRMRMTVSGVALLASVCLRACAVAAAVVVAVVELLLYGLLLLLHHRLIPLLPSSLTNIASCFCSAPFSQAVCDRTNGRYPVAKQ